MTRCDLYLTVLCLSRHRSQPKAASSAKAKAANDIWGSNLVNLDLKDTPKKEEAKAGHRGPAVDLGLSRKQASTRDLFNSAVPSVGLGGYGLGGPGLGGPPMGGPPMGYPPMAGYPPAGMGYPPANMGYPPMGMGAPYGAAPYGGMPMGMGMGAPQMRQQPPQQQQNNSGFPW